MIKKALSTNYNPEIDASEELDQNGVGYYQSLIGILRWIVEMGRMEICMEVSSLSSYIAMPRDGHMQQVLHIFAYLKINHNARIVFDHTYLEIDDETFEEKDWSSICMEWTEMRYQETLQSLWEMNLLLACTWMHPLLGVN